MSDREGRTPDWLLERVALGELSPAELAAARRRLEQEPDGADRLATLEASNREILEDHPAAEVLAEVRRREAMREPVKVWHPWMIVAPSLVVAAMALFVFVDRLGDRVAGQGDPAPREEVRLKGLRPHLVVYRDGPAGRTPLDDGAAAAAGDKLQLAYVAVGAKHGVLLSIDGAGAVTLHHPADPSSASDIRPEGEVRLPFAIELDAAPGFERFFLLTSSAPIDVATALEAARQVAAAGVEARTEQLPFPGIAQHSLLLRKVPR